MFYLFRKYFFFEIQSVHPYPYCAKKVSWHLPTLHSTKCKQSVWMYEELTGILEIPYLTDVSFGPSAII